LSLLARNRAIPDNKIPPIPQEKQQAICDTEDSSAAWDICIALRDNGLLAPSKHGNIIRFAPPLMMNEEQLHDCVEIIIKTLMQFER